MSETVIPSLRWTVETTRQESFDIGLNRGETIKLQPRFYLRGTPMVFPANSTIKLYYRAGNMTAGTYHELSGTHHSDQGRVNLDWTPDVDGGQGFYSYTLVIQDASEAALVRANGSISIAETVFASGTAPATVTTHSARTDNPHSVTAVQVGLDDVAQAEAEGGVATTRRAWSVLRVWQAIAAWWTVNDAPIDGTMYARQDGAWEPSNIGTVAANLSAHINTEPAHGGDLAGTARPPTTHAPTHATGGPDPLTPADIGALGLTAQAADVDPAGTAIAAALLLKLNASDGSVTNAREWTADTVAQAEAETGAATTRRAWTAQRVRQAIAAAFADTTQFIRTSGGQNASGTTRWIDIQWLDGGARLNSLTASRPIALDSGNILVSPTLADFRTLIEAAKRIATREIVDATGDLVLADNEGIVIGNRSTAQTITIPLGVFPADAVINVLQKGAGAVTVTGAAGVLVNGVDGGSVTTTPQWQGLSLVQVAVNEWIASGAADIPLASDTTAGLIKKATTAQAIAGTVDDAAVTPAGLDALIKVGLVLKAPDDGLWKLTVDNTGTLITEEII